MPALDTAQSISLAIRDQPLEQVLAMGESVDRGQRLALYWADMRSRWRCGQQVTAEDYLSTERGEDEEFIVDLIYAEYVLREEFDAPLELETYGLRFPDQFPAFQRQVPIHEGLRELDLPTADTLTADITAKQSKPQPNRKPDPQRIGKYVVVAKIGSGGQCDVYRAVHPDLGREVAIKVGRPSTVDDPVPLETLRREGQLLSELRHPHLARVFDLDVHEHRPYLVLEYVRGPNLYQSAKQTPFQPHAAAEIIAQVARAMAEVHRAGLVHGDCKPHNIVLDPQQQPRLIDFGLSWRFDAWSGENVKANETVSGTLAFMSPEQVSGDANSIDHRSDIFNLGGTLYFLLTGKPPYLASDLQQGLQMVRRCQWDRDALQAASCPESLKRICRRAMAADPEQRYGAVDEMAADLERFNTPPRISRRTAWGLAAVAASLVVVWALSNWWGGTSSQPQPPSPPIAVLQPLDLNVKVWEDDQSFRLPDMVPLRSGDALQIQFNLPAGMHATLWLLNAGGQWQPLVSRTPAETARHVRYPASASEVVPLTGAAGTELILACVGPQPVTRADLPTIDDPAENWPSLSDAAVLRVDRAGVTVEQRSRDLGSPQQMLTPESRVTEQLESLHAQLTGRGWTIDGIAFAHQD